MNRAWGLLCAILAGGAASAQVSINLVNGASEISAGSFYDFGKVAQGDVKDTRFRLRNPGAVALTISTLLATGLGFSLVDRPSLPFVIAPSDARDITVRFTAGTPGSYTANFQVNTTSLALQASSVASPVVGVLTGCTGAATNSVDFGRIETGQTRLCNLSLRNPSPQPLPIATLAVLGNSFSGPTGLRVPLTLAAGETVTFTLNFTPTSAAVFTGTFTVETRSFPLAGIGFDAPIPKPLLEFDAPPESARQPHLSVRLPSPATAAASGFVTLGFTPDSTITTDDPAILFTATGSRSVGYSVRKGDTQVLLGGQASALFQTGTTAGRIRFTLSAPAQGFAADPATVLVVAPSPIAVDQTVAARRPGYFDLHVYGFDNTLSAGSMSFSFADASGAAIAGGTQSADFSGDFRTYFGKAQAGGSFHLLVTFPVSGDASVVTTVNATLSNSTGKSTQVGAAIP